jgi:hypothetical protein
MPRCMQSRNFLFSQQHHPASSVQSVMISLLILRRLAHIRVGTSEPESISSWSFVPFVTSCLRRRLLVAAMPRCEICEICGRSLRQPLEERQKLENAIALPTSPVPPASPHPSPTPQHHPSPPPPSSAAPCPLKACAHSNALAKMTPKNPLIQNPPSHHN